MSSHFSIPTLQVQDEAPNVLNTNLVEEQILLFDVIAQYMSPIFEVFRAVLTKFRFQKVDQKGINCEESFFGEKQIDELA